MDDAKGLCSEWQSLLSEFRGVFTLGGWARFAQWVTGTVLCAEEHTITQILTGLGLEAQWRNVEHFAEYGSWDREAVERQLMRLVEQEHPARWGRYHPVAIDDTKEHRTSADVWGTCTFHESGARSPNRATTVRAHNWVVMGDLAPGKPWTYMPTASRLYFRKSQLPSGERFRTKTAMAVEMLREVDAESAVPILAAFDGAYAMETVIKPCLNPPQGRPPDRVRHAIAARCAIVRAVGRIGEEVAKGGRPRKWGKRLPSPQEHDKWNVPWQQGRAYVYGRIRTFRYKCLRCCWSVSGPEQIMYAFVFDVPGYDKLWATITSADDLSAGQTLSANGGRFRQEDGFRDHKQRLGMEECRAWTKEPVLRTFQIQMTALTLLRLMQFRLGASFRRSLVSCRRRGTWANVTCRSSICAGCSGSIVRGFRKSCPPWTTCEKPPQTKYPSGQPTSRAA